jgi:hypothetical protein
LKRPDRFTRQHEAFEAFVVIGGFMHTQQIIAAHPDIRGIVNKTLIGAIDEMCAFAQALHVICGLLPCRAEGCRAASSAFGSIWIAPMSAPRQQRSPTASVDDRIVRSPNVMCVAST